MVVAVVGGGLSGAAIRRALEERGASVRMLSRSTGFDVLHADAARALSGADAVIEAPGRFTLSRRAATEFFARSSRVIGSAVRTLGIPRHVLLSIVNCDRPEVQGYGYFAAKAAQERVARDVNPEVVLLRSTQWFEFAEQNLQRFGLGPLALVPSMTIQPVALSAVAGALADVALGRRGSATLDLAGPTVTTLWSLTRALRPHPLLTVPLPLAGTFGRAFRQGALLPAEGVEIVGPDLQHWLAGRPRMRADRGR